MLNHGTVNDQTRKQKQLVIPYSVLKAKKITFEVSLCHPIGEGREQEPPPGTPNATTLEPKQLWMNTTISPDDRTELDPGEQPTITPPQRNEGHEETIQKQAEPASQEEDQEDILLVNAIGDEDFTQVKPKPTPRLDGPPGHVKKGPSTYNQLSMIVIIWN